MTSGTRAGTPGKELQAFSQGGYPESETAFSCSNMEFDDFDGQSEQLSGHGQEYVMLSSGPFRGRTSGSDAQSA